MIMDNKFIDDRNYLPNIITKGQIQQNIKDLLLLGNEDIFVLAASVYLFF